MNWAAYSPPEPPSPLVLGPPVPPEPPPPQHSAYTWVTPAGQVQVLLPAEVKTVAAVPVGERPAELLPPEPPPPPPTDPDAVRPVPPLKCTVLVLPVPPAPPVMLFCCADWPPLAVTVTVPPGAGPNVVTCPELAPAPAVSPTPTTYGMTA